MPPATPTAEVADTGRSSAGWSYYGTALECLRKFAFANREYPGDPVFVSKGPGGATGLGSFAHELLAAHYLHKMRRGPDPLDIRPDGRVALGERFGVQADDALETYTRFVLYVTEYAYDKWEPLAVEEEFCIGLLSEDPTDPRAPVRIVPAGTPGSVLYTARLDLVVRDRRHAAKGPGKIKSVDHKTAAVVYRKDPKTGKVYTPATNYGTVGQMHGHEHIGATVLAELFGEGGSAAGGPPFGGVVLNFFQTRGDKAAFGRFAPAPAPHMVERFPKTIWTAAGMISMFDRMATSVWDWPPVSGYFCSSCRWSKPCRFGASDAGEGSR
jgi:hypothetical protein